MSDLRVHEWCACIHFAFAASIAFLEQECNNSVHTHLCTTAIRTELQPMQWLLRLALLGACAGKLVTFDNTMPRLDDRGAILKAHDGTTQRFGGGEPFFYHAMGYPACNETGG